MSRRGGTRRWEDDLRASFDPNDDEIIRDVHARLSRRAGDSAPEIRPPMPLRPDEVVCRSCRLVVRRRDLAGVALAVCDDCYHR